MARVGCEARQEAMKLKELALQRQDDALRRARDAAASLHLMSDEGWSTAMTAQHISDTRVSDFEHYSGTHASVRPHQVEEKVSLPPITGLLSAQIHSSAGQNPQQPWATQPTVFTATDPHKAEEGGHVLRPPLMEVGADSYIPKGLESEESMTPIPADRPTAVAPTQPLSNGSQTAHAAHDKHLTFDNHLQFVEPEPLPQHREGAQDSVARQSKEGTHSREGTVLSHTEGDHSPDEEGYTSKSETEALEGAAKGKRRTMKRGSSLYRRHSVAKKPGFKVHKQNEMGEIVDKKGHRAWEMACGLQLGIRVNVGMNQGVASPSPEFDTFQESLKLKFPPGGSSITPKHDGAAFNFKDYAPAIFRNLREIFRIDTADYLVALCNTQPDGSNALRIMGTPGKSGSLFFFSNDMRFIVKTLPKREALLLREILPAYYQHVKQNPGTYLPRFYGLHRWKPDYGRNVRFVVMNNVFATNMPIHRRFDLKGSTMGRSASPSDKAKGQRCILKDLDFLELNDKVRLNPARKKAFLDQIRSDCHLLMSLKIMDYSLLLGVHFEDGTETLATLPHSSSMEELIPPSAAATAHRPPPQPGSTGSHVAPDEFSRASSHGSLDNPSLVRQESLNRLHREDSHRSHPPPDLAPDDEANEDNPGVFHPGGVSGRTAEGNPVGTRYFIGIIDILMLYTRRKKMERVWKTMTEGEGASSQPPAKYAIRFCKFVESIVD